MQRPDGGAEAAPPPPGPRRDRPRSVTRARLRLASTAALFAGLLAAASALTPWWYTSTSSSGTSSTAEYLPGSAIYVSGGGGGGYTSYTAQGLPTVATLYGSVLGGLAVVALLALGVAVLGFGRSLGRWNRPRGVPVVTATVLAGLVAGAVLAAAVPLAQPPLYRSDDPHGSCSPTPPPGPCSSFWGTSQVAGVTRVWGAGAGWWLDLACCVLFAAALMSGSTALLRDEGVEGTAPGRTR